MAKQKVRKEIKKIAKKWQCPNNHLFILALITVITFLLVELTIRIYDLYKTLPAVDVPSHFFAGIAFFTVFYWIITLTRVQRKKISAITLTIIGAFVWEIFETLQELIFFNPPYLKDFFWWDGFWDVIITIIGGLTAILIVRFLKQNTALIHDQDFK